MSNWKKELIKKYPREGALMGDRIKLWLCWEKHHLFEKKTKKICVERCPECSSPSYQPSEIGINSGSKLLANVQVQSVLRFKKGQ